MSDDELSDEDKKAWWAFTGEDLEDEAEEEDFRRYWRLQRVV